MAERIVVGYKRFFEVRILHHFWLDEGSMVFDLIQDNAKKDKLQLSYDVRNFLSVEPTQATEIVLRDLGCIYKNTALGFVVAIPKITPAPIEELKMASLSFDFVLKVINADFFNYTALTLVKQQIFELYYQPEDKIYRFKENVPVFNNFNGTSRTLGGNKVLFLSNEIPLLDAGDKVESLIKSGNALKQLISDQPNAILQDLNSNADNLPVYVNQGDSPAIEPPLGLKGVPPKGISLTSDLPNDLFALIRIQSLQSNNVFSLFKLLGSPNPSKKVDLREPVFEIRFKNRSTIWKYYDKKVEKTINPDNSLFTEANPLPLSFFGNASTATSQRQKPSSGPVKATFDNSDPPKLTGLISEIFVQKQS
ncbi:MAG TPA: hypothetical protein VK590_10380 [Saprospiraceae bacterium]|nr:hypothetical protein [Saprospiraceae bacterium]